MLSSPRPELNTLRPCVHGAISDAEAETLGVEGLIDFSANCNPLGLSPAAIEAMTGVDSSRYPDDQCLLLRRALATRNGICIENVAVGNGSTELIWSVALAYLRPGDTVLILGPSFGEYARAASIHGAQPVLCHAQEKEAFRPNWTRVAHLIEAHRPRLTFVCNPNNPTGVYLGRAELANLQPACDGGLLVVDEAYINFVEGAKSLLDWLDDGLILLRSMTKDYGLAGLRLGYALAAPQVIGALNSVRPPWNVNAMAQGAGLAALADEAHLARARRVVIEAKAYLTTELSRLGLKVLPTAANFLLVRVGDAATFRAGLLERGCCVRDCASFGLPEFVRIGVRTMGECQRLVADVKEVLLDER